MAITHSKLTSASSGSAMMTDHESSRCCRSKVLSKSVVPPANAPAYKKPGARNGHCSAGFSSVVKVPPSASTSSLRPGPIRKCAGPAPASSAISFRVRSISGRRSLRASLSMAWVQLSRVRSLSALNSADCCKACRTGLSSAIKLRQSRALIICRADTALLTLTLSAACSSCAAASAAS